MSKGFVLSVKSYAKNWFLHVSRVLLRRETLGEALADLKRDSKKLREVLREEPGPGEARHRRAVRYVKVGREKYNAGNYEAAEKCFRDAVVEDAGYQLATLFLGNALYKMGRSNDAVAAWRRVQAFDPTSAEGLEALKKMNHVKKQQMEVIDHLEDRTRKS